MFRSQAVALLWLAVSCAPAKPENLHYRPRTRTATITTVPLLVHEQTRTFPFLAPDFARGGVLDGKEVYGYAPSTLVAYAGDTLQVTITNPEDDAHTFVIDDPVERTGAALPPQTAITVTIIARAPGIYPFRCTVPAHQPFMVGQLVVPAPPAA
jgi:plastocyanin